MRAHDCRERQRDSRRLPLSIFDDRLADRRSVLAFADAALRALDSGNAPSFSDVVAREKIIAVDVAFTVDDMPSAAAIARMRQSLVVDFRDAVERESWSKLGARADESLATASNVENRALDGTEAGSRSLNFEPLALRTVAG